MIKGQNNIDENKILEETLIDLSNKVWSFTLNQIRTRHIKPHYDYESDPEYQFREGLLCSYNHALGNLLEKLGNSDYSLMVNNLTLVKKD